MHAAYIDLLNDEATVGATAVDALLATPGAERAALLRAHPEWLRVGTMNALLAEARTELDSSATTAAPIVELVHEFLDAVPAPADAPILVDRLRGSAWRDRASVYYRQGKNKEAVAAAKEAAAIFGQRPALVVHHATALFVEAQACHALGLTKAAMRILDECRATFAEHGDTRHWVQALAMKAICLFDLGDRHPERREYYERARAVALEAEQEARRLADGRELARIHNTLGYCNLALRDITAARRYFGKAFTGFHALHMEGEVQRTIRGIALAAREQGQRGEALEMLHVVYREFLERGMPATAAGVLVEITDTVAELTKDVAFAQEECARLRASLGAYDLPASVAAAVAYAEQRARAAETSEALQKDLAPVRAFFTKYAQRPETPFLPPA
jgi:tetratricopeptide (TPR) repeat protein